MPDPDPLAQLTEWQRQLLDQLFEYRERTGQWPVVVWGRRSGRAACQQALSQRLHSNELTD
jgi:hypothetical protein